jgi:large repetitive protein
VTLTGATLGGAAAGNYSLTSVAATTADITPASSATALVSSQNPSFQGSNVTFTATVTPMAPASTTPTGNVQFYTNGVAMGSPVALTNGVVSVTTADLPAGTNTVMAAFLDGGDFLASNHSVTQVVRVAPGTPSTIGIRNNADGTVTVTFAGTPDAQYVVQAVENLAAPAWENVSTNTAGTDGHWTFTDSKAGHSARFYRAMTP